MPTIDLKTYCEKSTLHFKYELHDKLQPLQVLEFDQGSIRTGCLDFLRTAVIKVQLLGFDCHSKP